MPAAAPAAPVVGCVPCAGGGLARTCKHRVDRSLTHAGAFPTKIISFMWDSLYDCTSAPCSCAQSLSDQIVQDRHRPILSTAAVHKANSSLELYGFNLLVAGDSVALNLTCFDGRPKAAVVRVASVEAGFGVAAGLVPALQRGWSDRLPPWASRCAEGGGYLEVLAVSASRGAATWPAYVEGATSGTSLKADDDDLLQIVRMLQPA